MEENNKKRYRTFAHKIKEKLNISSVNNIDKTYNENHPRLTRLAIKEYQSSIKILTYMMYILIIIKTNLFMNITRVDYNYFRIFTITTLISFAIMYTVDILNIQTKYKKVLNLVIYSVISMIMFIDVMYYSYFTELPTVKMLGMSSTLMNMGDIIKTLLTTKNLMIIIDIPILIIIFIILGIKNTKIKNLIEDQQITLGNLKKTQQALILFAMITVTLLQFVNLSFNNQLPVIINQELFTYHITDIRDAYALKNNRTDVRGENSVEIVVPNDEPTDPIENLAYRAKLKQGNLTGIGKDKNLIVLQVEALQNFVIGLNYNDQEITPNLNKLVGNESSIYYKNYYQLTGRGNTSDAEFVTMNSLYPSMEEPTYNQYYENTFYGLPWLMRDNGYTAWSFHGFEKQFWNREVMHPKVGFERLISQEDFKFEEKIGWGIPDDEFFNQSIKYLKELNTLNDNPFFAFMVTLTSHAPFTMPEEYQVLNIKENHEGTILGNYLQSIHYVDKALGKFIQQLKDNGLYDDTIIALYGDHFAITAGDDNNRKLMTNELGYEYDFNSMMNIPLIIHVPGENVNQTVEKVGSQLDFYPTIQNIMGYDNTKGLVFGRDMNNYAGNNLVGIQTHMIKGSVISKDYLIEMSRDGMYEHSRAIDLNSREELDPLNLIEAHELVIKEIDLSDSILKNNLLKERVGRNGI